MSLPRRLRDKKGAIYAELTPSSMLPLHRGEQRLLPFSRQYNPPQVSYIFLIIVEDIRGYSVFLQNPPWKTAT